MPTKRRVAIVEDNTVELDFLETLLIRYGDDMEVVGKFKDTMSAWKMIESNQVEGVFLDIGFQEQGDTAGLVLARKVKERMSGKNKPWIVFVTGTPEHARAAIDVRPFGFLDKPVRDRELENILNEIRKAFPLRQSRISVRYPVVQDGARIYINRFLEWEDVVFIHADIGRINIQLQSGEILKDVNTTLKEWRDLNIYALIQVHRKTIANLKYVDGYKGSPEKGEHTLLLKTCVVELEIGERYFKEFKMALEGHAGL